jgi:tRNA threonylcarbamoyladenosine biosynthesis protein TsaE
MLKIQTNTPEETQQVGRIIGQQAWPGDIYLLTGPLGAGKTCLTQGIAWGLGVIGYARSPTFVLMTRYQGRFTLHHLDLYRIKDPLEAWDLGLDEQLSGDGVCVVEWADRAEEVFPEDALWIALDYAVHTQANDRDKVAGRIESVDYTQDKSDKSSVLLGEETMRTITFGKHSDRYNALLELLASAFAGSRVNS